MRWRLNKDIWGSKDKRVSIRTIPERALAELNDKAQEQIRLLKEISKSLKEIKQKLSADKSAERKPEKTGKMVEIGWRPTKSDLASPPGLKKEKTGKPRVKAQKLHKGETVDPFKKDGTS